MQIYVNSKEKHTRYQSPAGGNLGLATFGTERTQRGETRKSATGILDQRFMGKMAAGGPLGWGPLIDLISRGYLLGIYIYIPF